MPNNDDEDPHPPTDGTISAARQTTARSVASDPPSGGMEMGIPALPNNDDDAPLPPAQIDAAYKQMEEAIKTSLTQTHEVDIPPSPGQIIAAMPEEGDTGKCAKKKPGATEDVVGPPAGIHKIDSPLYTASTSSAMQQTTSALASPSPVRRPSLPQVAPMAAQEEEGRNTIGSSSDRHSSSSRNSILSNISDSLMRRMRRTLGVPQSESTRSLPIIEAKLVEDEPEIPLYEATLVPNPEAANAPPDHEKRVSRSIIWKVGAVVIVVTAVVLGVVFGKQNNTDTANDNEMSANPQIPEWSPANMTETPDAVTPDWPDLYDAKTVLRLHIKLKTGDFSTINGDESYDVEVPALLWEEGDGEDLAQLVSVRRKSATSINDKESYKLDINEYDGDHPLADKLWHKVQKLSLENGDDTDVVSEQLAWFMNAAAANVVYPEGHMPGLANFATLTAHLVNNGTGNEFDFTGDIATQYLGVYVNVEQVDKQFLKNRLAWDKDQTYLYKQTETDKTERKEVGCEDDPTRIDSPTYLSLECVPFSNSEEATDDCTFDQMNSTIDMEVMLSQAAISAFISSSDDMLSKGRNFFFVDYSDTTCSVGREHKLRSYYQWDLDKAFIDIYSGVYFQYGGKDRRNQTEYQRVIFSQQAFLDMYTKKMLPLLDDSEDSIVDQALTFLTDMQPILTPHLEADPNSKSAVASFELLKTWLKDRQVILRESICLDTGSYTPVLLDLCL